MKKLTWNRVIQVIMVLNEITSKQKQQLKTEKV